MMGTLDRLFRYLVGAGLAGVMGWLLSLVWSPGWAWGIAGGAWVLAVGLRERRRALFWSRWWEA